MLFLLDLSCGYWDACGDRVHGKFTKGYSVFETFPTNVPRVI